MNNATIAVKHEHNTEKFFTHTPKETTSMSQSAQDSMRNTSITFAKPSADPADLSGAYGETHLAFTHPEFTRMRTIADSFAQSQSIAYGVAASMLDEYKVPVDELPEFPAGFLGQSVPETAASALLSDLVAYLRTAACSLPAESVLCTFSVGTQKVQLRTSLYAGLIRFETYREAGNKTDGKLALDSGIAEVDQSTETVRHISVRNVTDTARYLTHWNKTTTLECIWTRQGGKNWKSAESVNSLSDTSATPTK